MAEVKSLVPGDWGVGHQTFHLKMVPGWVFFPLILQRSIFLPAAVCNDWLVLLRRCPTAPSKKAFNTPASKGEELSAGM